MILSHDKRIDNKLIRFLRNVLKLHNFSKIPDEWMDLFEVGFIKTEIFSINNKNNYNINNI